MPLYEYQCETCGHTFEELVFSKKDEPSQCPACGVKKVKRMMSCASFMSGGTSRASACAPSAGGFS